MKNPLNKRFKRDLLADFGKYAVIIILLVSMISFVSGFLVADNSMLIAYNESFEKYNIEDGHFTVTNKLNKSQINDIEDLDITIYENYYYETLFSNNTTMRIFKNRTEVNKVCLMEGSFPSNNEIAIDRMYADNNNLKVGDIMNDGQNTYTISGLVALSDYSALFSDNSDMMFDAIKFGVAIVNEEMFSTYSDDLVTHEYAYKWNDKESDEILLHDNNEQLSEDINGIIHIDDFLAQEDNQAIHFTGDDMGGDKAMMIVLLYIVIIIVAFVFTITINNTIFKESNVIGTLRASGFSKSELIRHYMTLPLIVSLLSAIVGNILGYTVLKNFVASMYYGSYSLPTYVTVFNFDALVMTTIVPLAIIFVVTYFLLRKSFSYTPLQFIRHDLKKKNKRRSITLSKHIPIMKRFRLRIILQNMSNYVVIFIGIILSELLLFFGLMLPDLLDNYKVHVADNMLANYQTILSIPSDVLYNDTKIETALKLMNYMNQVETENPTAEKFSIYSLKLIDSDINESVTIYGVVENSKYVNIDPNKIYISNAYAKKYKVNVGDTVTLKEPYEDKYYSFKVDDIYDYDSVISIFMSKELLNKTFDYDADFYCGYFSDTPINDVDEKYIGSVIDLDALTKISRQLDVSMGDMMGLVDGFAILIFTVVIYLLSKTIIEKNANNISIIKILGYENSEISRLYIVATSIMVIIFIFLSMPIENELLIKIWEYYLTSMFSGYINVEISQIVYIKAVLYSIISYLFITFIQYRKVQKINLAEALKNVE